MITALLSGVFFYCMVLLSAAQGRVSLLKTGETTMIPLSTGDAAGVLGIKASRMVANILRQGCPDASMRIGGKRGFTLEDLYAIRRWYQARGKAVNAIDESKFAAVGA